MTSRPLTALLSLGVLALASIPLLSEAADPPCYGTVGRARAECLRLPRNNLRIRPLSSSSSSVSSASSSVTTGSGSGLTGSGSSVSSSSSSSSSSSTPSTSSSSSSSSALPTRSRMNCVEDHRKWHSHKNAEHKLWHRGRSVRKAEHDAWHAKMISDHTAFHQELKQVDCPLGF